MSTSCVSGTPGFIDPLVSNGLAHSEVGGPNACFPSFLWSCSLTDKLVRT